MNYSTSLIFNYWKGSWRGSQQLCIFKQFITSLDCWNILLKGAGKHANCNEKAWLETTVVPLLVRPLVVGLCECHVHVKSSIAKEFLYNSHLQVIYCVHPRKFKRIMSGWSSLWLAFYAAWLFNFYSLPYISILAAVFQLFNWIPFVIELRGSFC